MTNEQHLKNIEIAVAKAVGTYDELVAIRSSFIHIQQLVLNPPTEEKGEKDAEKQ